jgi:hypothetical protein
MASNYRGRITKIVNDLIYVEVPDLGVDQDYGPCEAINGSYSIGDYVLVNQIEPAAEDVVIVGKLLGSLQEIAGDVPIPSEDNSLLVGQDSGGMQWQNTGQIKTILDIDDIESGLASIGSEVQPVNRGGTGKTVYTIGNYLKATAPAVLSEVTPTDMRTDLSINNVNNTSDADKPVSTAQQAALDLKKSLISVIYTTAQNFNTITIPGDYVFASGTGTNTNAPELNPGTMRVIGDTTSILNQLFISSTTFVTYSRNCVAEVWGAWYQSSVNNQFASRRHIVGQSIPNNVGTTVLFDTANKTSAITYSAGVFTVPYSGAYDIKGAIYYAANGTGRRQGRIRINGAYSSKWAETFPDAANTVTVNFMGTQYFSAGDQLEIMAVQTSGAALSTVANTGAESWIDIVYLGP